MERAVHKSKNRFLVVLMNFAFLCECTLPESFTGKRFRTLPTLSNSEGCTGISINIVAGPFKDYSLKCHTP